MLTSPFGGVRLPARAPQALRGPLTRAQLHAAMSIMPGWARDLIGLSHPAPVQALLDPTMHAYARQMRWAFGTPARVRLATARVAAGGSPSAAETLVAVE